MLDGRRRLAAGGLYGRRKMTALAAPHQPAEVSSGAVDRAMRILGLSGVRRDKGIRTTIPAKDGKRAGDLLDRDFTAAAPNRVWVTDFTYCPHAGPGSVYVAFIVDVFAQRIVAWHASTTKTTDLVMTPLRMALWQRDREGHPTVPGQLIHHSDAGSQYTSIRFTEHLDLEGIRPSIGSVGDAYDNALMETINGLTRPSASAPPSSTTAPTRPSPTSSTPPPAGSTGTTTARLHGSLGMVPPVEYEQAHYAALKPEMQPA